LIGCVAYPHGEDLVLVITLTETGVVVNNPFAPYQFQLVQRIPAGVRRAEIAEAEAEVVRLREELETLPRRIPASKVETRVAH
jgi:hypothetical protein